MAPWLYLGKPPREVTGEVIIQRGGAPTWKGSFTTGTDALHYDLSAVMWCLFWYEALHCPGRAHYVYISRPQQIPPRFRDGRREPGHLDSRATGVRLSHPLVGQE
ncbi:hypothetical protein [Streptomyces sp. NPDC088812]|uniref:hypothetical protein n=1 Tax=Streptomyces sp. NPDC088812 TaxID=3365905 RepID=UPI00380C5A79